MKRLSLAVATCGLLVAATAAAETQVYYGFQIGITNAPPPPRIVYQEAPRVVMVPGTTVYVVEDDEYDCDVFRSGTYWYAMRDGYWYRARSHRGPFVVVDVRRVPRSVFSVPARHWRHHPHGGPPGLTKKHGHSHGKSYDHGSKGKGKGRGKG